VVTEAAVRDRLFTELYREHRAALVWQLRCQGASEAEACDAVQEAFAAALRAGPLERDDAWPAWLRTVSRRCYLHARGRNARPAVEPRAPQELPESADHGGESAGDAASARLHRFGVLELLRSLPERQRLVFTLHFEGLATAEIAAELEMQEAAVRKNLSRARTALKARLPLLTEDDDA
jgi:RNA polymerase sigma-70 factor (ECF subfamily)